jgi:hypothetical protein
MPSSSSYFIFYTMQAIKLDDDVHYAISFLCYPFTFFSKLYFMKLLGVDIWRCMVQDLAGNGCTTVSHIEFSIHKFKIKNS